MNIAEASIKRSTTTWVLVFMAIVGGIVSYTNLSQLEDPEFTIKSAKVSVAYPGASAYEVEEEVTKPIEEALQQLGQLSEVTSISRRGVSIITPEMKDNYGKEDLPGIWDEMRRKLADVKLPQGASAIMINDDFGDVNGVYFAITGEGYEYREIWDVVDRLQTELLLVDGVKRISITGAQDEVIYIEMKREQLANLGISKESIYAALEAKNLIHNAGSTKIGREWVELVPTGEFESEEEFEELLISGGEGQLIYLKDVAEVKRGYVEPPSSMLFYNGMQAIGMSFSTIEGGNVVKMGQALVQRIAELESSIPLGIEINPVVLQYEAVTEAVNGFIVNLLVAVVIVIVVLFAFMGLKSGLIIGFVLFLTIVASMIVMDIQNVILQRISLGALVIALGMLVDNAIVVVEGMIQGINSGKDKLQTAKDVVSQNAVPLAGATLVAIFAFGPVGLSDNSTGEFCSSLFVVLYISLGLSWITAVTVTPLLSFIFLKSPEEEKAQAQNPSAFQRWMDSMKGRIPFLKQVKQEKKEELSNADDDPYSGKAYQLYKRFLLFAIKKRWITVAVTIALFFSAILASKHVDSSFFPASSTLRFYQDFWMPSGTDIRELRKEMAKVEAWLIEQDHVRFVTTAVGSGHTRFQLTYSPDDSESSYGQFLIEVDDYKKIDEMLPKIHAWISENCPEALTLGKKLALGPGDGGKIQIRFSGPDYAELRRLADEAMTILAMDVEKDGSPAGWGIRTNWRDKVKILRPEVMEEQARVLGITREDIANELKSSFEGLKIGVYREKGDLIDIVFRAPEEERLDVNVINDLLIYSPAANARVPMRQVVNGFTTEYVDSIIARNDKVPTITVHADRREGLPSVYLGRVMEAIESIPLKPGYQMEWGGEYEDSAKGQEGIASSMPLFVVLIVLIVIALFDALKTPFIIFSVVPLSLIGVFYGLLLMGQPMGFMAILGTLSLSGMLIKNAIVLIDQINMELSQGKEPFWAVVDSGVSRMRPVAMAALTTIFGMLPLLADAFFVSMSVAIMFGLGFATVLTLIIVPTLYTIIFRIPIPKDI
ncbi:MAG: efflux RND transporter permease subunit [Verrucomicrobiota bacterium]